MLQPHRLIDELENVSGGDKGKQMLSDGPFSEVLKATQVIVDMGILVQNEIVSSDDDVSDFPEPLSFVPCFDDRKQ